MASTNTIQNKIHIGEVIRINSALTDSAGADFNFADLTEHKVVVSDEFGNSIEPIAEEGDAPNVLSYEVDTKDFLEGKVAVRIKLEFPSTVIDSGTGIDIIEQELFNLEK